MARTKLDPTDPSTWTEDYILGHCTHCLTRLQELNKMAMYYTMEGDFPTAVGAVSLLSQGLGHMLIAGCCGDLTPYMYAACLAQGMLFAFGDASQFPWESESSRREKALDAFQFAKEFAREEDTKDRMLNVLSSLKAGLPLSEVRDLYAVHFPDSVVLMLNEIDKRLFQPELRWRPDDPPRTVSSGAPSSGKSSGGASYQTASVPSSSPKPRSSRRFRLSFLLIPLLLVAIALAVFGSLPRMGASLRKTVGGWFSPQEVSEERASLAGNWIHVNLSRANEDFYDTENQQPARLLWSYYTFREDGTCEHMSQICEPADEASEEYGFTAFGINWQCADSEPRLYETYKTDGEKWLSITTESGPPDSFFESSGEYGRSYSYEVRDDVLFLWDDNSERVYFRADSDFSGPEQFIAGLSNQACSLSGAWTAGRREKNTIWTETYTFCEDGSFFYSPCGFYNTAYEPMENESGWYVIPMGHPGSFGTYMFNGESLLLTYEGCDVISPEEWTVQHELLTARSHPEGGLELDGARYVYDSYLHLEELFADLGVDYSAS